MRPLALLSVTLGLLFAQPVIASNLPAELEKASQKLVDVLKDKGRDSLTLGDFSQGGKQSDDPFGPGLRVDLAAAIERVCANSEDKKIAIAENADIVVNGRYEVIDDPDDIGAVKKGQPQMLVLKIELQMMEGAELIFPLTIFVNRIRDIARASELTASLDLEDDTRRLHSDLRQASKHPGTSVNGTQIKSSVDSPVTVQILTRPVLAAESAMKPREPSVGADHLPFVSIATGEVYEVQLSNSSAAELAVAMSIDGIDQFTFSEDRNEKTGEPKFSHWILKPHQTLTIHGWHKTADPKRKDSVLRFLVTKYGDGASQYAPHADPSKVGVIHLAISRSHEQRHGARGDAETGFGPPVEVKQEVVERVIDPPHEFISIRYAKP